MLTITPILERQSSFMVLPGKQYYPLNLQAVVTETSPALNYVTATIDWNDSGAPTVFDGQAKPLTINETRNLPIGTYFITLSASNFLQPTAQAAASYFTVEIQPQQVVPQPQNYLFGPILPLDDGFPNAQQWNLDVGNNLAVLKSSVKMLLITSKGERIMQPSYGTLLRRIVFEPNTSAIAGVVRQEIDEALNLFEPRVSLDDFDVVRSGPNDAVVKANFLSKISQSSFSLALEFTQ